MKPKTTDIMNNSITAMTIEEVLVVLERKLAWFGLPELSIETVRVVSNRQACAILRDQKTGRKFTKTFDIVPQAAEPHLEINQQIAA